MKQSVLEYKKLLEQEGLLVEFAEPEGKEGEDRPVTLVTYFSGGADQGTLFLCKGAAFKEAYLKDAVNRGAVAYVSEKKYEAGKEIPALIVNDARKAQFVLGEAFCQALGDKAGITRFADAAIAMDETLVMAAVDISGRGQAYCELPVPTERVGSFDTELAVEFFYAFARDAKLTLHVRELTGGNSHHIIEAAFKAVGRTMRHACELDPRVQGIPSTKGSL